MTAASPKTVRAELADALDASRAAREEAERELHRSVALRSRAGEALERTARRPGLDESERARLRAEYAAADRVVAERRAAVDKAQEFERAASVVAGAFEDEAASASPLAAALLQLVGSKRGGTARRGALASGRTAPAARVRSPRPRTA
ncbi:hypothetical protein MRBLWH7_002056 [Microbacterium sp. LWH7-1.2]|jgi:hypothetical protein|uniref:hypothetical protein n=1 Tax=Microbacterium sp. LWH7-1.2 TaxID=3135257 RepID=UPI00313A3E5A